MKDQNTKKGQPQFSSDALLADLREARMALAYIRDKAEFNTVTRTHLKDIAKAGILKSGGPITLKETPGTNDLGPIIDASRADLVNALKWAMEKEPSPCRCLPFATPPHICVGHRAILDSENADMDATDKERSGDRRLSTCSGWAKRRPKRAGEYLIAVQNVSKNNPNKSVVHAILHENGALTGPILYDGSQVNIRVLDHIKIKGWMAMPSFPNV
jgi:hypothetical protein